VRRDGRIRIGLWLALVLAGWPVLAEVQPATPPALVQIVTGTGPNQPFRNPRHIFCDPATGEVFVADSGNHRVVIFDRDGTPVYSFTHTVWRDGRYVPGEPLSLVATPDGTIFLLDALSIDVAVLDYRGTPVDRIQPARLLGDSGFRPLALALTPEGEVAVLGMSRERGVVLILSPDLRSRRTVRLGETGQLVKPTGFWVDGRHRFYVTDMSAAAAVQVFTAGGERVLAFGKHDSGWGNFSLPTGIAVQDDGRIWVVDMIRQVVSRFDADGRFETYIGGKGSGPGSMAYPSAVAWYPPGRIYVLEKVGCRYQVYATREGGEQQSS